MKPYKFFGPLIVALVIILICSFFAYSKIIRPTQNAIETTPPVNPTPPPDEGSIDFRESNLSDLSTTDRSISILVDDFRPQPNQGEPVYFFNRLGGDRGALNESILDFGTGQITATVSPGNSWGGTWTSLNHPIREGLPIDFSSILPPQILPAYQSRITGITVSIAHGTLNRTFKIELKDGNELRWKNEISLDGGKQIVSSPLPALGDINQLVWVLDDASSGDYVVVENVSLTATTQITDTATAAFVWSYGMLLHNWNPKTGLVRDKSRDASSEFDAIQATGSLAAATVMAEQLGVVTRNNAIQIVDRIGDTLLFSVPRFHGLFPHFSKTTSEGEISIVPDTEWSSVDTVIAAVGLLSAQQGLGLDTSSTEQLLQEIDWNDLVMPDGISHGYTYNGDRIPSMWDVFGGESWLVALTYAGVTGQVPPLKYPSPPTANGSGFIGELAFLFVPPPSGSDYWGTDWTAYRLEEANNQITYYRTHYPTSCFDQLGLFGLSAAEVPDPSSVPQTSIYQAFGVGGAFSLPNNGTELFGAPVVIPHYSAMVASLSPEEAVRMWIWLIDEGHFSPLNNVESLTFLSDSSCTDDNIESNQLRGSWNLTLQTLGWGRYLAERDGHNPILWQAVTANPLLSKGYLLLAPSGPTTPVAKYIPQSSEIAATPIWDNSQVSCDGKPYHLWSSPGTRLYERSTDKISEDYYILEWEHYLDRFAEPSRTIAQRGGRPSGTIKTSIVEVEKETVFGTFRAVRMDLTEEYDIRRGNMGSIKGQNKLSHWYVCGYGLVHSISSNDETTYPSQTRSESQSESVLSSFTPSSTNESHVRYIIDDIQLGNMGDYYRINTTNEETAEALRRWDAGIRVTNIEDFERKTIDGQWQIVHAGTENSITGGDVILNSD